MKKIVVHGVKEKTPMGFCDVPRKNLLDFIRDMKSISVPNEPRYKPLRKIHQAASEGDTERLQRMISRGKHSVHDRDFKQRTALHFACAYGQVEVVGVLLRNNCDIDAVDRNFITPLMKAVQNWAYECVCTLLKHGADPNRMDKNGNTSLHYAVSEDNQALAKCLLKYSANMEQKNKDGFTPLLLALKENKIEMAKFLVKKGANIHVFDEMKRNTLLYAIRWDSKDMVNLLLDEGIDFFFKDVFGWTALRYAIEGTSKGSREILMNYDEKLRRKNQDGIPECKNFEDNSLDKHPNDPTSETTLLKSSDNACDFDDEPDISKFVLTTCPSNICGAGDQEDKSETKETVDESDELTTELLEENISDDSENIRLLRGEGLLSRKFHERGQKIAARKTQVTGQRSNNTGFSQEKVWTNPTLKSSTKEKVSNRSKVGMRRESHHFIIESDIEIESLEETFSYDNEDKQSVSDDGDFSGTTHEWCQNDTIRQTRAQDCMYPNLKSSTEGKISILREAGKMAESPHFIIESDLEIESLEETFSCDSEAKQLLYLPQIDDSHFSGATSEGPENNLEVQIKESAKKFPYLKTANEMNDPIQNKCSENKDEETLNSEITITSISEEEEECPDARGKSQSMQTRPMDIVYLVTVKNQREENIGISQEKDSPEEHPESQCSTEKTYSIAHEESDTNQEDSSHAEQVVELTSEEEQPKEDNNDNKQCLNIFKRFRPKRIGSLLMTKEKIEENAITTEKKEIPKEDCHLKSTTEEGESEPNDSPAKKNTKSLQTESTVMFISEKGQKCQLDTEKNKKWHMFKRSQPKGNPHLPVTESQSDESTIVVQVKDSPEQYSQCKATNGRNGYDSYSSTIDVKPSCVDSPREYADWKPTMGTNEYVQKDVSVAKYVQFREESNLKIKTKENLYGNEASQPSNTSTHIHPRYALQLSLGLTSTPTNILNEGGKGFQKKFLEWKPPTEMKDSDSTEVSAMMHGQGSLADVDIKLETESQDYLDSGENIQSSNTITSLQSKCTPHLSVGITSRSTSLLTDGEKDVHKKNPDWKPPQYLIGSKALASSDVSMLKHKQEFPPEAYLQMKTEESQKNLERNENTQSSNAVIQPKQILHLQIGLALRPTDLLNEGKKGFCVNYPEQEQSSLEENYVPTEESTVKCGQEFPAEADWKIKTEDFRENLDDNESIHSSNSFTCLQPRPSPYLSLGLTQRSQNLLNEGGKGSPKKHLEWKKKISTEREDSILPESSVWKQEHPSEVDIQMKADDNLKNLDGSESSQSSDTMPDLPLCHIPASSTPRDLLKERGKEEDLQMKLEESQGKIDGNESIQSSDNVKYLQPRRIRHLLMGLIPRPINILSRRGKDSHKKCTPCKNPTEIKEFDTNAKLERQEIKTLTPVMLEDDQNLCDDSKNNHPLVEATRKKCTSNETEDGPQSYYGCALAATAHDVSTASVVAAIVAASVVATAAPAAAVAAASAAIAAVVAAAAPAAAAVASATAAIDALANVAPGAAPDSSAVPVAAATAATAAAVPAATAAGAPDAAPAVVAAAAAAGAAAAAVTSLAAASLTAVSSAASVAAVVAVAVTAEAGSDAPTVAPASAAVAAVAAATGPAAAAALVASVAAAAAAVTPCVPPAAPESAAAPSTVAAATAAAAAVVTHAAASPAVAAAAAAAAAAAVAVPTGTTAAVAAVASSDIPTAAPVAVAAATKGRISLQKKHVEEGKQQSPVEEAEEQDGIKKTISTEKFKVPKPEKYKHDPNALTPVTESCSAKYLGSPLRSTPAFDSYKELLELKEINVQILTEKNKVENELSEVKEENSQLEKKIVRKNERICTLRSIIKEQLEKKRSVICAYNEVVEELRDKKMIQRRGEQYNRQVTETQDLEICLKTKDVELKQLQKEKEHTQKMEDHLQILELENTSLIATVKKQKKEIEHLQRHVQNPHKNLAQSTNFTETAAHENQDMWNNQTSVITEMENIIKSLKSEVSSVKISKEFSKKELEKYKRFYLEELRNKNFLLHELNRTNESQEQSHTELHMKFQQNISASNTLNTKLVHECSCVEKTHKLENKDFLPGENLVLPSSSTESTHVCMAHCPWTSEDDMRDLSKGLSDLKQSIQLTLETQKKKDNEVGKELTGIGKSFKMTDHRHEIGECGSHGDFETCRLGMSTPVTMPGCLAQAISKPYSEFLKESYTTSTINAMETKIRSLKSTLSKLKVSRALRVLELERYKYLYYEELSIRKSVQYYLNKSNENSEKNRSKLHMETQHSSSAVNAQSMRPLTECSSTGCLDSIPGPRKSLLLRKNQTASSSNSQPSASGLEDCLKMVHQVSQ